MAKRKLNPAAAIVFGGGNLIGGLFVALLLGFHGCTGPVVPGPKPPTPGPAVKAVRMVVVHDTDAPTIPLQNVLDCPRARAGKQQGVLVEVGLNEKVYGSEDKIVDKLGYGPLITAGGGAPCLLCFDADNNCVKQLRVPTDLKAFETFVDHNFPAFPPALPTYDRYEVKSRGREITVFTADNQGSEYIDLDGRRVYLGANPSPQLFGTLNKYSEKNPVFPSTQWRNICRGGDENLFGGEKWIFRQLFNDCVGNGWAGALMRARAQMGMEYVKLSPSMIYALLNGGEDRGASISAGIKAIGSKGTCPFDLLGDKNQHGRFPTMRDITPEMIEAAKDYLLIEAYACETWDELCSAIQAGFMPTGAVRVGSRFNSFDSYGVCGFDPGQSNHCVSFDGMTKLPDGRVVLDMYNSWGYNWGPFKNGRAYIEKKHVFAGRPEVCVIRVMGRSKSDKHAPPAVRKVSSVNPEFTEPKVNGPEMAVAY